MWLLEIVGSSELDINTLLDALDAHVSPTAIYGAASGSTAVDDRVVLTKLGATAQGNVEIDWCYFTGSKVLPSSVVTGTCNFLFPRPLQVWNGAWYTPVEQEGGLYTVSIRQGGVSTASVQLAVSGPGYRMLSVVETGTQAVCFATGGLGGTGDAIALIDLSGGGTTYATRVQTDGASYYWRLNDPSGTTAVDPIGGANGTISGVVTLGQPGAIVDGDKAMTFDGTTGKIITSQARTVPPLTIECWFNVTGAFGPYYNLVSTRTPPFNTGDEFIVYVDVQGKLTWSARFNGAGASTTRVGLTPIVRNQWHHIVAIFTPTTLVAYLDGVPMPSALAGGVEPISPPLTGSVVNPIALGRDQNTGSTLNGSLDDVAIYPFALTAAQVAAHYALAQGRPAAPAPLGGCLDFFYLNNSKTLPTVGLTGGSCTFTKPTLYGHYAIQFLKCPSGRYAVVDGSTNPIKDGPYYRVNFTEIYAEVALDIRADPPSVLEMEFLGKGNGWTIVRDWLRSPGINWHRGLPGDQLTDLVADIGTMTFALDNSERNSAGTLGYYSPDHANRRYGFYLNIGVRYRIGAVARFTGVLNAIDPVPGKFGPRTVSCEVVDWMSIADRTRLTGLPILVNARGDDVFQALINSLPGSAQPQGVEKDVSPDIFPYTLDRTRDEETQLRDELYRLSTSGISRCWTRGDGVVVYEARTRRATVLADVDTFPDSHGFKATHDRSAIVNRAQVSIHPRIPGTTDLLLYALSAPVPLQPGVTFTMLGPWTDPANPQTRVGAVSLHSDAGVSVTPVVDYKANTKADGTGIDITASVTLVVGLSGNATSFTITSTQAGFLTLLQQRGKPLYDYGETVLPWEDATSIAQFGVTGVTLDMPYQADARLALEVAQFAVFTQVNPTTNISGYTRIVSLANTVERDRSISRQISDRIAIQDPVTGIARSFFINAIEEKEAEDTITTQWMLVPADTSVYWYLEIGGRTELNLTTRFGFGMVVGHTDIAHGDTHIDAPHTDVIHTDTHGDVIHVDAIHQDVAHVDTNVHTDAATHSDQVVHTDTGSHTDVTHQDIAHGDTLHADGPGVFYHYDTPHQDAPHSDGHADYPHTDVAHNDYHGDAPHNDSPGTNFGDHTDCYSQGFLIFGDSNTSHYSTHTDCYSSPYGGSQPNPYGPTHWTANFDDWVINPIPGPNHYDQSQHWDFAHGDHSDSAHGDSHADIAHNDGHSDAAHYDGPHQDQHGDTTHTDVAHADNVHQDVAHQDLSPHSDFNTHNDNVTHSDFVTHTDTHTDVIHQDVPHSDVAHGDRSHADQSHVDSHTDTLHGDLH